MNEHQSSQQTMESRAQGGELLEYRLEQVETTLKEVRRSLHDWRNDLQPLALAGAKMNELQVDIARAFSEIRSHREDSARVHATLTDRCSANDGQFKRWFNIGIGFACACTLLGGWFGNYLLEKVKTNETNASLVPAVIVKQAQQERTIRAILRRGGVDPDLLQEQP